jgi:hypothetical protein
VHAHSLLSPDCGLPPVPSPSLSHKLSPRAVCLAWGCTPHTPGCHVHTAFMASDMLMCGIPRLWVCVASLVCGCVACVVGAVCTRMGTHCVLTSLNPEFGWLGWGAWLSALQAWRVIVLYGLLVCRMLCCLALLPGGTKARAGFARQSHTGRRAERLVLWCGECRERWQEEGLRGRQARPLCGVAAGVVSAGTCLVWPLSVVHACISFCRCVGQRRCLCGWAGQHLAAGVPCSVALLRQPAWAVVCGSVLCRGVMLCRHSRWLSGGLGEVSMCGLRSWLAPSLYPAAAHCKCMRYTPSSVACLAPLPGFSPVTFFLPFYPQRFFFARPLTATQMSGPSLQGL